MRNIDILIFKIRWFDRIILLLLVLSLFLSEPLNIPINPLFTIGVICVIAYVSVNEWKRRDIIEGLYKLDSRIKQLEEKVK